MKKLLSFFVVVCLTTSVFAQQQIATLLHNDSITVYYGVYALQSAHAAAVNGDVITLSDGTFNSVNITKAVTIRGAGMWADSIARTMPTILQGDFTITVPQDSTCWLTLEGIYHYQTVKYQTVHNPQFLKCKFKDFNYNNSSTSVMNDARFINCIIEQWTNTTHEGVWCAIGTEFVNSVILGSTSDSPDRLVNCIAHIRHDYANNKTIINSIVYCDDNSNGYGNSYTSFNTIGINYNNWNNHSYTYFDLSVVNGNNLWNYTAFNQVFKNFNGTYSDAVNFELKDDIASSRLGTDGTQVGIYGGRMPFNPSVRNPLIGRTTVNQTTTSDGKLEVDIQITSDSE